MKKKHISKDIQLLCRKLRSHNIGKLDTDFSVSGSQDFPPETKQEANQYLESEEQEQRKLDEFRSCNLLSVYNDLEIEQCETTRKEKSNNVEIRPNCLLGGAPPGQKDKKEKISVKYEYSFQPRENSLTVHKVCPYHDLNNLVRDNPALREKVKGHQLVKITSMILTVKVPKWVPEDKLIYHWEIMDVKEGQTQVRAYPPIKLEPVRSEGKEFYVREIPLDPSFFDSNETRLKTNSDMSMYPLLFLKTEGEDMYKLQHYDQLMYESKMRMTIERRDPGVALQPWLMISLPTSDTKIEATEIKSIEGVMREQNCLYEKKQFDPKLSKRNWKVNFNSNSSVVLYRKKCENCEEEMLGQSQELHSYPKKKICEQCFDCLERDLVIPGKSWRDKVQCRTCAKWTDELYGKFKKCSDCVTALILEQKQLYAYYCNDCQFDRTSLNINKWRDAKICEPCNSRRIKNRDSKHCIYCLINEGSGIGTTVCNFCHQYLSTVLIPCEDKRNCWICQHQAKEEYAGVLYCTDCWSGKMTALFRHRQRNVKIYEKKRSW